MIKSILVLPDGSDISSGSITQNAIKAVKLTEMVNIGSDMVLGSTCANKIEASLFSIGGSLDITAGDEVTLYHLDEEGNRKKKAVFILEAPSRPTSDTMKLVGYDRVVKLDKDLTEWLKGLNGWPYSLKSFARMVCQKCGVLLMDSDIPNGEMQIQRFERPDVTGRMIMQWVGELACRFVRANADGNLEFAWYTDSGVTLEPTGENYYFSGGLQYEKYDVAPIEAVQVRMASIEDGSLWPAVEPGVNSYIIEDNPLFPTNFTDETLPILENIRAALEGVTYTPAKVKLPAREDISAGSIVKAKDKNGKEIQFYVMQKTTSGQTDTLETTGSARRDSPTAQNNKSGRERTAEAARGVAFSVKGALASVADVFLDPGLEEFETINRHLLGSQMIEEADIPKYDFNSDGEITITDLLLCRSAALGLSTLANWEGAVKTPVAVYLDATNTEKAIRITGTNMWGRDVEYYIGFNGASIGRVIGSLAVGGLLAVGSSVLLGTNAEGFPTLALGNEEAKTLSWKDSGDGTSTLIGS